MSVGKTNRSRNRRRAAMLVLIAVTLPLFLIMAAFTVDVAWMQLVRTELRTATDAAARAGAKELGLSQNEAAARDSAKQAAARNLVAGEPLLLADADIVFGQGAQSTSTVRYAFTPSGTRLNAVRVTGDRSRASLGGSVDLLFAGVLGVRDFQPKENATSVLLDRDICLVVDRSGSMMERLDGSGIPGPTCGPPDPVLSRWGALSTAVTAFLDELERTNQDEHVALVSYSSNDTECGHTYRISEVDSDLVSDYSVIRDEMHRIGSAPVKGYTAISAGLDDGIDVLTGPNIRPYAVPTIVLMTDGIHNLGPEPIVSARRAAQLGIVIHTITFSSDADIARMEAVAAATGGRHFHANNLQELVASFREIAATLPVLLTE
jgi:Ca-activated chloride channel homolog